MAVEAHYRVVIEFQGAEHSRILAKLRPVMEVLGVEDTWVALHRTSYMPDSLSIVLQNPQTAAVLNEVAIDAVRELGGILLVPF